MASKVAIDVRFEGQDNLTPTLDKIGGKLKDIEQNANQSASAISKVGGMALQLSQALGQAQGTTSILAQGLLNVATAGNQAGAVMAVFDTILKVVIDRMNEARSALQKLIEAQIEAIDNERKALEFENQIKRQID